MKVAIRWLAIAAAVFVVGFIVIGFGGAVMLMPTPAAAADCSGNPGAGVDVAQVKGLSVDQTRNAGVIIATGKRLGVPERGWVIAVAVAYQESKLVNVAHGDDWWFKANGWGGTSDSRGLFQQRDSWGPESVRLDPAGAAGLFYQRLVAVEGWDTLPLWQAGQAVQRSAFPREYQQWEPLAQRLVGDLAGVVVGSPTCRPVGVGEFRLPLPVNRVSVPAAEHHDYPAVDLGLRAGERQPVFAMTAGVATPMNEPDGCGRGVFIRNDGGEWLYCHLSELHVEDGQQVPAGGDIGVSGWSGHVEPPGEGGAHLHVQLKRGGKLVCLQPVIDALKAGQNPPALDALPTPSGATCLGEWAEIVRRAAG